MIVLKRIDCEKGYRRVKKLYKEAFPANERAPFFLVKSRAESGKAELLEVWKDEAWLGFVYVLCREDLAYIFYFAIDSVFRGKGYGTEAVGAILKRYEGKRVFLALEDWREKAGNRSQRLRRHRFYEKCGLKDLPYRLKEASVVYAIMGSGGVVEPEEYKGMADDWLGGYLKHVIDMRIITEA